MKLLLDHGAKVRLPKGEGAPIFNAHPIFLASFADNADIIGRLHKAGDHLDDKVNLLGRFPATPWPLGTGRRQPAHCWTRGRRSTRRMMMASHRSAGP
jgi:hypothetical protein